MNPPPALPAGAADPTAAPPLVRLAAAGCTLAGRRVLRGLDWEIAAGEHWLLTGPNGAGKSTLLRLVAGELWPSGPRRSRLYGDAGGLTDSPVAMRSACALVSPELIAAYSRRGWDLPALSVVLSGAGGGPYPPLRPSPGQRRRAEELLASLGLAGLGPARLLSLSHGQVRRVLLARALMGRPRLLLLDEWGQGLDPAARELVRAALAAAAAGGAATVQACHRRRDLLLPAQRELRLAGGRVVHCGLLLDRPGPDPGPAGPPPLRPAPPRTGPLFELTGVRVVRGGRTVLAVEGWRVLPGESWAVCGESGAGKSTLLLLLHGDLLPAAGGRLRRFLPEDPASVWEVRSRCGLVSAEMQAGLEPFWTVRRLVLGGFDGGLAMSRAASGAERRAGRRWLDYVGLGGMEQRRVDSLSAGQVRRALLARALVTGPEVLLLDEPLAGLDRPAREAMAGLLAGLARAGVSLIWASHHPAELPPEVTMQAQVAGGRLTAAGPRP